MSRAAHDWLESLREGLGTYSAALAQFGIENEGDLSFLKEEDVPLLETHLKEAAVPVLHARIVIRAVAALMNTGKEAESTSSIVASIHLLHA